MDVHPTKNVSIGIDPYPVELLGNCSPTKNSGETYWFWFGLLGWPQVALKIESFQYIPHVLDC